MNLCNRCKGTGYERAIPWMHAVIECKGCGGTGKIKPKPNAPVVYSREFSKWMKENSRNTRVVNDNRGWGRKQ